MPRTTEKPWACRLGRHKYHLMRNDSGEPYYECIRCQHFHDAPPRLPPEMFGV